MKIKKFICAMSMVLFMGGTSTTMVSCNDDDVKTVLELVDMLFGSTSELSNTSWVYTNTQGIVVMVFNFQTGQSGALQYLDENDKEQNVQFSYSLDTQNNILTLTFSDNSTWRFTITEYTAGQNMTLNDGDTIYKLYYAS